MRSIADKGDSDWPEVQPDTDMKKLERWLDGYFAGGLEWDCGVHDGVASRAPHTITESGIKFRFDLRRTPLKLFSKLGTSFSGFRAGIQFRGVWSFDNLGYVFELGAGSW